MYPRPLLYDLELLSYPDSLDLLSKSMRQLTEMADRLADPSTRTTAVAQKDDVHGIKEVKKADGVVTHELVLQPRFDVRETKEGLLLIGATPGLRKEELSIEIVDSPNGKVLEVSGETAPEAASEQAAKDSKDNQVSAASAHAPTIRSAYLKFKRQILLPQSLDPQTLQAKYRDGLLSVTIGHKQAKEQDPGRVKYTIEG